MHVLPDHLYHRFAEELGGDYSDDQIKQYLHELTILCGLAEGIDLDKLVM